MNEGRSLKNFKAKNGRKVILRTPRSKDLDGLLELINAAVDEKADILINQKFTRKEEAEWLNKTLLRLEKDEAFYLVADIDEEVVAFSDLQLQDGDQERVGLIGIIVKSTYRNLGIGTEIIKSHFEKAASFGLKGLTVNVFDTNKRAIHVYEKMGFVRTDKISKKYFKQGRFIDEVIMTKLT